MSCRFYPVRDSDGQLVHAVGKKPGRTLAKIGVLLAQNDRRFKDLLALLKGVLLSIYDTSAFVPFLGPIVEFLLRIDPIVGLEANLPEYTAIEEGVGKYTACAETYAAFEELYGLNREDERVFVATVTAQIQRYGFPCVIDAPFMQVLLDADL